VSNQPEGALIRELYARFGLAYYESECLHRELCFIHAWSGLGAPEWTTRPRVDERLTQSFTLTLGDVASKLDGVLPAELILELHKAVENRNFLAHHFWFERAHLMFTVESIRELISELDGYGQQFHQLDKRVSEWRRPKVQAWGLTDDVVEDCERRILAGEPDEPLPGRQAVKSLEKKLCKLQRLARVWQIGGEHGQTSLIFELADGTLWQLCDVGLGPTKFQEVDSAWTELLATRPHLPADVIPRPKSVTPWEYEFTLANGAVLWVKPGRIKQTFRWGIRQSKRTLLATKVSRSE
jgi:hypothetical protein